MNTDSREQQTTYREKLLRGHKLWFLLMPLVIMLLVSGCDVGVTVNSNGTPTSTFESSGSPQSSSSESRNFSISGTPMLNISDDAGAVHIHAGTADGVTVQATKHGDHLNDMQVSYNQSADGKTITVTARISSSGPSLNEHIDLDISTPKASNIGLKDQAGTAAIESINGQIEVTMGSGTINLDNVDGQMRLHTGSGVIEASTVNGRLTADTGSGLITVTHTTLSGSSTLKTGSGSITFDGALNPTGAYDFETNAGLITVTLPSNAAFQLDVSVGAGTINNQFGSNAVGTNPRASLRLRTGAGIINVQQGS